MSKPLDLTTEQIRPSRRDFMGNTIAGATATVVTVGGLAALRFYDSTHADNETHSISIPVPAAHKLDKPLAYNRRSRLGGSLDTVIDPYKAAEQATIFMADYAGTMLTDRATIARHKLIPASMQKSFTGLLVLELLKMTRLPAEAMDNLRVALANTLEGDVEERQRLEAKIAAAQEPLLALTERVKITPTAATLNCTHLTAGEERTVVQLLTDMFAHSDNGAAEALAVHCSRTLIEGGYIIDDGAVGSEHRGWNRWAKLEAKRLGLSANFNQINAHGLPGYETLIDKSQHIAWQQSSGDKRWKPNKTSKQNPRAHFARANEDIKIDSDERLPLESGICTRPGLNNVWGWMDGLCIMAHWQMRYPRQTQQFFQSQSDRFSVGRSFKYIRGKHGTSNAALACNEVIGERRDGALVYAMVAGQMRVGDHYKVGDKIVESTIDQRYPATNNVLQACPSLVSEPTRVVSVSPPLQIARL